MLDSKAAPGIKKIAKMSLRSRNVERFVEVPQNRTFDCDSLPRHVVGGCYEGVLEHMLESNLEMCNQISSEDQ